MGQVRRMDMKEFKQPVYKAGEIAEKTGRIKQPLPMPVLPPSERPSRGKRPNMSRFEAMPGSPEGKETLPQDPRASQPIEPIEPMDETTTKRRRKKITPDTSLVNTNNLLGTGGSL